MALLLPLTCHVTILAWRPRAQHPPLPVGLTAGVPGLYSGRARFQPAHPHHLPPVLRDAVGRVVELGFAGLAPAADPFAGQKLYLEWCTDDVFGGFLIPEQDLEFLEQWPDPTS